jgi:predicted RND superfamily exporter protein
MLALLRSLIHNKSNKMFHLRYPKTIIALFLIFSVLGVTVALNRLYFRFSFEDFFPKGDPDLEFYYEFKSKFEPDDNFLLIAIHRKQGIFDKDFLGKVKDFSLKARDTNFEIKDSSSSPWSLNKNLLPLAGKKGFKAFPVLESQSLLQVEFPVKTPFAFTSIPAVHLDEPERYESDKRRILSDERLLNTFVSADAKTTVVVIKTIDNIQQEVAEKLMKSLRKQLDSYAFDEYHILGRANFQTELVAMQIYEFALSALVSGILVLLIMWLIFRRFWGVVISISSIALGLFIFVGIIGIIGKPLDSMALLYPIIMIIVGTSDVIHVMSKYVDELQKGNKQLEAIKITMKEIGLSVFLTSFTTAIGFLSLVFSKLEPIRNFGINASIGVMTAYFTVIFFTTAILTLFDKNQIIKLRSTVDDSFWYKTYSRINLITQKRKGLVMSIMVIVIVVCSWGISMINTNTKIEKILPIGASVTKVFFFFEKNFSGFRPFEIAVIAQNGKTVDDFEIVQEMAKVEAKMLEYEAVKSVSSITWLYKSMNRAFHGDRADYYKMPEKEDFYKFQALAEQAGANRNANIMISKDRKYARISSRLLDIGGDNIKKMTAELNDFFKNNTNNKIVSFKQTGTGVIVDKNLVYVRDSLLQGLGFALLVITLIMVLLYRNLKMVIVALVPNIIPMLIAGAILGFSGIPLEAGVAIVFSIIFGIAVDDTIHILGRFRLLKMEGLDTDKAISITLVETGKAVTLTTVVLFFGFVILLFSSNPPAVTIGLLISSTLLSALICDVFLIPVLLRIFKY